MAAMQRVAPPSSAAVGCGSSSCNAPEVVVSDQFPAGLRVLVVDDDTTCLRILEQMLRRCLYNVTACSQAAVALNLLRERKGCFDVVLSDVHMPDMDGYKLLECVGLEMDLPVIMMSADGRTSAVMKGIKHGACDYLIKPVRDEELKNIWQHVVRKKWNENKELEHSGSLEDNDRNKRGIDDTADYASSANEGTDGPLKSLKKRGCSNGEDDGELENDDPSTSKKPRVVWSVELHQQFVSAVNQLGIDKAVPKRILELMNVPGLTRENVASHLQKFRLYLKRISGVSQQGGMPNTVCGPVEPNVRIGSLGRVDIQALTGQIPQQTVAALRAELLGRSTSNLVTGVEQPPLFQASFQGPKCIPVDPAVAFGQSLLKCQSNISKQLPQSIVSVEDAPTRFGAWPSNNIGTIAANSKPGGLNSQNSNILIDSLQQHRQQQQNPHHQLQQQSTLPEPSRLINVQPSCLVVPTESSSSFQAGNSSASVSQNCGFNRNSVIDYNLISSQSNNSLLHGGQVSDGDPKTTGVFSAFAAPRSISPSISSCSVNAENCSSQQARNSGMIYEAARQMPRFAYNICDSQGSHGPSNSGVVLHQGTFENPVFSGEGTCIPNQFACEEFQPPAISSTHGDVFAETNINRVKQEPVMEIMNNGKVDMPVLEQCPMNDLMSVFTE